MSIIKTALATALLVGVAVSAQESRAPVFIGTDDVDTMLLLRSVEDLKIFDCTVSDTSLISFH